VSLTLGFALLYLSFNHESLVPIKAELKEISPIDAAFRCCGLMTFVILPVIIAIALTRKFTGERNKLSQHDSKYLQAHVQVLNNSVEQCLIFCLNILAMATIHNGSTAQRLVALTCSFVISRYVFWLGYLLGVKINFFLMRVVGFGMSATINLVLGVYNIYGLTTH
jgi:uncharacterized MAPEG superfamily protein